MLHVQIEIYAFLVGRIFKRIRTVEPKVVHMTAIKRFFLQVLLLNLKRKKALASVLFPSDKAVVVMQTRCHGNQNKNNITIQTMYERQTFCLFYTDGNISNSFRTTGCKEMGRKNGSKFNGSI